MNITYRHEGDYLLPNLEVPEMDRTLLNKYGRMRLQYLQEQRPGLYTRLLLSGKLYEDLTEVQETAESRVDRMVAEMVAAQGIDESLKAREQMVWVGAMNMVRLQAEEIVLQELIYC